MITRGQVTLVQGTWAEVEPISEEAAKLFYRRLFEMAPEVRGLFTSDIRDQGRRLMQMLGVVVKGLDRLDRLLPTVHALGERHLSYGVREEDYDAVGAALLWTLNEAHGAGFTSAVEEAWAEAYGLLADAMKDGAAAQAGRAA